ncbi:MAG: hypothetical protein PHS41_01335 [Victivallaceae bacterium]|nr:hypothetical protein [Victivallaceae bacterium]
MEHANGHRLAVCGLPGKFNRELSEAKHRQLTALVGWISAGQCRVLPQTSHAQVLIPLLRENRLFGIVVLNSSIEPIALSLELRDLPEDCRSVEWRKGVSFHRSEIS